MVNSKEAELLTRGGGSLNQFEKSKQEDVQEVCLPLKSLCYYSFSAFEQGDVTP